MLTRASLSINRCVKQVKTMSTNQINVIGCMAADPNGCVGLNNQLPWNYPDEFEHFKSTTAGHIMIMGRKTLDSTPVEHLKKCISIVFTKDISKTNKQHDFPIYYVTSIDDYHKIITNDINKNVENINKKIFIIGGVEITHLFFENQLINEFLLRKIHHFKCFVNEEVVKKTNDYTIFKLTK